MMKLQLPTFIFAAVFGIFGLSGCVQTKDSPKADISTQIDFRLGADAIVAEWTETLEESFRRMAVLGEDDFIAEWQDEHDGWVTRLRAVEGYQVDHPDAERYEARIFYEWALGRIYYPSAHQALANAPDFEVSDDYDQFLEQLDVTRGDFLDLEEYTRVLILQRNIASNTLKAERGAELNDGTRDLTARRLANQQFEGSVRCYLEREALDFWLENFAADGLTTEVEELSEMCPGEETDAIVARYEAEIDEREGHIIETFKTVDGHDLEIHIYVPEDVTDPAPATVWLHGGGWRTGSWSWCGPCVWMKERGHIVAQVEYRITGRHGSEISHSLEDAYDAIAWMREHAERFGADPNRIVAAGFSAGGHLSLAANTFMDGNKHPDLVVAISPCTDLSNDGYTIGLSGGYSAARSMSPRHHVHKGMSPMFVASADQDDVCSFEASADFVRQVKDAGVDITFMEQLGGGHFFLRESERSAKTKAALEDFFDANGY